MCTGPEFQHCSGCSVGPHRWPLASYTNPSQPTLALEAHRQQKPKTLIPGSGPSCQEAELGSGAGHRRSGLGLRGAAWALRGLGCREFMI